VQLFNKLTGMIGKRVTDVHQPAAAVDRPGALFQIVDDVIQRQDFTLAGGTISPSSI
jgi:hypothetical protein